MGVLELVDRFRLGRNGKKNCASSSLVTHILHCNKKNKFSAKKPSDNLDTGLRVYRKKKHMKHMHFRARALILYVVD
jgi:hypothetical protein